MTTMVSRTVPRRPQTATMVVDASLFSQLWLAFQGKQTVAIDGVPFVICAVQRNDSGASYTVSFEETAANAFPQSGILFGDDADTPLVVPALRPSSRTDQGAAG